MQKPNGMSFRFTDDYNGHAFWIHYGDLIHLITIFQRAKDSIRINQSGYICHAIQDLKEKDRKRQVPYIVYDLASRYVMASLHQGGRMVGTFDSWLLEETGRTHDYLEKKKARILWLDQSIARFRKLIKLHK